MENMRMITQQQINSQPSFHLPYYPQNCPAAEVGMKILHSGYGELTIIEVENRPDKTIIRVEHSNGKTLRMTWNILWANNMIKIL